MATQTKILLIDDDEAVIAYLSVKLSKFYDVISTTLPEMAVPLAQGERPDVVLCDIDMPEMTGGDVAAALAENPKTASIPLIYLSALVSPAETRDLNGYINGRPGVSKSASLTELMQTINAQLEATARRPATP